MARGRPGVRKLLLLGRQVALRQRILVLNIPRNLLLQQQEEEFDELVLGPVPVERLKRL